MLAELAAANAAFSVIKQAVQNSGDIAKAGSAIAKFVGAKEDLQKFPGLVLLPQECLQEKVTTLYFFYIKRKIF